MKHAPMTTCITRSRVCHMLGQYPPLTATAAKHLHDHDEVCLSVFWVHNRTNDAATKTLTPLDPVAPRDGARSAWGRYWYFRTTGQSPLVYLYVCPHSITSQTQRRPPPRGNLRGSGFCEPWPTAYGCTSFQQLQKKYLDTLRPCGVTPAAQTHRLAPDHEYYGRGLAF